MSAVSTHPLALRGRVLEKGPDNVSSQWAAARTLSAGNVQPSSKTLSFFGDPMKIRRLGLSDCLNGHWSTLDG